MQQELYEKSGVLYAIVEVQEHPDREARVHQIKVSPIMGHKEFDAHWHYILSAVHNMHSEIDDKFKETTKLSEAE